MFHRDHPVGSYVIEGDLGHGAVGNVFRARHAVLGSLHAIKLLRVDAVDARERLIAEGRAQAQLDHPNVVRVTDMVDFDGRPGLVMDLVRGPSLARLLERVRPSPAEAERIFRGIVAGVAAAHQAGIVHRDLKPSNVLFDTTCQPPVPRVADFGIARALAVEGGTAPGQFMGTLGYHAPEQLIDTSSVDARADVFSLGVILVELVTGRRPFPDDRTASWLKATTADAWSAPPGFPPHLADLAARCMRARPQDRPRDASAVLALLEDRITSASGSADSSRTPVGRALVMISGALAVAVSIAGAVGISMVMGSESGSGPLLLDGWRGHEDRPAESLALLRAAFDGTSAPPPNLVADLLARGAAQRVLPVGEPVVAVAASDRIVLAATVSGVVHGWRLEDGVRIAKIPTGISQPRDLALLANNAGFVVSPHPMLGRIEVDTLAWSLPSGRALVRDGRRGSQSVVTHEDWIVSVLAPSTQGIVAAWGIDGTLRWSVSLGVPVFNAISVEGGRIAVPVEGATIILNLADGSSVARDPVDSQRHLVTLSPDGSLVAERAWSSTRVRWVDDPQREIRTGPNRHWIAFSPKGSSMLEFSRSTQALEIVDIASGGVLPLRGRNVHPSAAAFLDDERVVTGTDTGTLQTWDRSRGGVGMAFHGHRSTLTEVVPTAGGWVSASLDGTVRIWTSPDRLVEPLSSEVIFSEYGAQKWASQAGVLVRHHGGLVTAWRMADGTELAVPLDDEDLVMVAVGQDRSLLLKGYEARTSVVGWDGEHKFLNTLRGPTVGALSYNGRRVFVAARDRYAVWDLSSGVELAGGPVRDTYVVGRFVGGLLLVAHGRSGEVDVWSMDPIRRETSLSPSLVGQRGVSVLEASPSDTWAVLGMYGGAAVGWRIGSSQFVDLGIVADDVLFAAVDDDGRAIFAGRDGTVGLWDLTVGTSIGEFTIDARPTAIALSGEVALVGDSDGRLHRWRSGQRDILLAHRGRVRSIATASDGITRTIGDEGRLRSWRLVDADAAPLDLSAATNVRVCRASGEVVAVVPFPDSRTTWAPEGCEGP